jgi:hypothetical protein
VYEDKYAEDCIADASDEDKEAEPWVLPTRKKSMDPRVGIAPPPVPLPPPHVGAGELRPVTMLYTTKMAWFFSIVFN